MDIGSVATINEDDGIVVELPSIDGGIELDPETEKPVTITVVGTYSAAFKKAQRDLVKDAQRMARKGQKPDAETAEKAQLKLEAACITAWDFTSGGKPLPITTENWTLIGTKRPDWRERVQVSMQDHERFFSKS